MLKTREEMKVFTVANFIHPMSEAQHTIIVPAAKSPLLEPLILNIKNPQVISDYEYTQCHRVHFKNIVHATDIQEKANCWTYAITYIDGCLALFMKFPRWNWIKFYHSQNNKLINTQTSLDHQQNQNTPSRPTVILFLFNYNQKMNKICQPAVASH